MSDNKTEPTFIDKIMDKVKEKDVYGFKTDVISFLQSDLDDKAKDDINSGNAFIRFLQRTDESEDINDVALNLFKKYKGDVSKIKKELEKKKYDLKEINKILELLKDLKK